MRGLILSFVLTALAPMAFAADCGSEEKSLRHLKLETWPGYYRAQDVAGLDAFLSDGFRIIAADGSVTAKKDELSWLAANPWKATDFVYTINSVTCPTEGVAIIVGEGRSTREGEGGARILHRYVSSNLLVKENNRWRAALSHISGVQRTPAA
jgi:hypothetical protein